MGLLKPVKPSLIILAIIGAMIWVACGGASTAPPPAATSVPQAPAAASITESAADGDEPDTDEHGREVFRSKGCAACHGQDAEGSAIAPALPGQAAQAIDLLGKQLKGG